MKTPIRTLALAMGCTAVIAAQSAVAHESGKASDAYVGDKGGHLITDGFGNCVKTGFWNKGDATPECGGAPAKAPEPEPAPVATPAPAPAPAPAPVAQPVAVSFTLSGAALFGFDSNQLSAKGKAELDELAGKLKALKSVDNVHIVGHTDSLGAESYNQQLSERRAATVKSYLVSEGVDGSVITTAGKGESSPVASNATEEGRAQNRRVEISIKGVEVR